MSKQLIILQVDIGTMPPSRVPEYMSQVQESLALFKKKHSDLEYAFLVLPSTIDVVYRGDMDNDIKVEVKRERAVNDGAINENTLTEKPFLYCNDQKIGVICEESIKELTRLTENK